MATFPSLGDWRAQATAIIALGATLLSACAATSTSATQWPILVQFAQPSRDPSEVTRRLQETTGVPVHYRAASSPTWHAVTLSCPTAQRCKQALQALRQSVNIVTVEVDHPASVPPPASGSAF